MNLLQTVLEGSQLASALHGGRWRSDRKVRLAALLTKVCELQERGSTTPVEAHGVITDILDLLVIHVRDYRGNYGDADVFANLLLPDGEHMWVVARDKRLHSGATMRETPKRHEAKGLLASEAMATKSAKTIGDIRRKQPDTPLKPYRSVLALPLFACQGEVIGCVSIDSSRRYYFERLEESVLASEIETNLAPYLADLALFLDACVPKDPAGRLTHLKAGAEAAQGTSL